MVHRRRSQESGFLKKAGKILKHDAKVGKKFLRQAGKKIKKFAKKVEKDVKGAINKVNEPFEQAKRAAKIAAIILAIGGGAYVVNSVSGAVKAVKGGSS